MLGHAVLRFMGASPTISVWGSLRSPAALEFLPAELHKQLVTDIDVEKLESLERLFALARPDVVINCIGVVKQLSLADDPLVAIPINALLPHQLARLCETAAARMIHISTDCVFSGTRGMYREDEPPDATSLYGRSKYLGEVDYPHAVTLRTSMIGHELGNPHGLVGWFLAERGRVNGFTRAIFSGLPTVELSRVVRDFVLPRPELSGVYHVSADPISKYDLLRLVAHIYGKSTEIVPDESVVIDRSLDSSRFGALTGYVPPSWPDLVRSMRNFS
ncbi:MAG: SDR family oxidoreductase [Gemmatimonadota bacterium]|nr:SDR family oxidoreductase [Gemmatimonadota bacterium]